MPDTTEKKIMITWHGDGRMPEMEYDNINISDLHTAFMLISEQLIYSSKTLGDFLKIELNKLYDDIYNDNITINWEFKMKYKTEIVTKLEAALNLTNSVKDALENNKPYTRLEMTQLTTNIKNLLAFVLERIELEREGW